MNIKEMNISARAKSCLLNAGYKDIEDIKDLTESELSDIHNISDKVKEEILQAVTDYYININAEVVPVDNSVNDDQKTFEFPSEQYELLQTPIKEIFKEGRAWRFCSAEHINILREFCAYSEEELLHGGYHFTSTDVDDIVSTLDGLSLKLRPDRYDKCIYIYPLSVKKYYFEKPDNWEYRLYNEAMISYFEWLNVFRSQKVVLWNTSKEEADRYNNSINDINELKEFVTEELEEIMSHVHKAADAMNKTQEGLGEQGVEGNAEIILEAVKDFMLAYKRIIKWRLYFAKIYTTKRFHRVIEEMVRFGDDILADVDELYGKHLKARKQFDEVESGNATEENLHIDFSIAFTTKTAQLDVALEELSNDKSVEINDFDGRNVKQKNSIDNGGVKTMNSSERIVLVQKAKESLRSVCNLCDSVEKMFGRPSSLDVSISELFKIEAHRFLMFLASSDGKIVPEERDFMNDVFGYNFSIQKYVDLINKTDTYSVDFENSLPLSMQIMASYDDRVQDIAQKTGNSVPRVIPIMMNFYETLGKAFIAIDGDVDSQENEDLIAYLAKKKIMLEKIRNEGTNQEVGIIGKKKGGLSTGAAHDAHEGNMSSSGMTLEEENALKKAKSYLNSSAFSYKGIISQLEYNKYSHSAAVFAADNCGADWFQQALKKAKSYLNSSSFSREGLIKQLEHNGFTHEQAIYGADNSGLNSENQALSKAISYLRSSAFSYSGLVHQLEFNGFSHLDAVNAADNCGADWFEQAVKKAKSYMRSSSFSREGLIRQLEHNGFTHEQAVYAVGQVGY